MKEIVVHFETFNFRVFCAIGPHRSLPAYIKRRQRRVYKPARGEATDLGGCYFHCTSRAPGVVWLPSEPRSPEEIGFLAHEMAHAVMDMHAQRSLNLDQMNDETFCYAIMHGVRTVLQECRRW